jgi:hypothetical protein
VLYSVMFYVFFFVELYIYAYAYAYVYVYVYVYAYSRAEVLYVLYRCVCTGTVLLMIRLFNSMHVLMCCCIYYTVLYNDDRMES